MCSCATPAYLRDPRTGKKINAATAVAIGQAVETSDGPAPAPDFVANAIQTKAANAPAKGHTLEQLKTVAAGVGIGFVFCSIMR